MKLTIFMILSIMVFLTPKLVFSLTCDGKITRVLSGSSYCSSGERVGFIWTGGSSWMCSSNKNTDALIMTAYITGKVVSVRDGSWPSCFDHPSGTIPNHIWFPGVAVKYRLNAKAIARRSLNAYT